MFQSCHVTSTEFKQSFTKLAKEVLFTALTFSTVSENKNLKVLALYLFNITVVHFFKNSSLKLFSCHDHHDNNIYIYFLHSSCSRKAHDDKNAGQLPKHSSKKIALFISLLNNSLVTIKSKKLSVFHTALPIRSYFQSRKSNTAYKSHPIWLRH